MSECNKVGYDKIGAMVALATLKARGSTVIRYYYCKKCRRYHLTSKPLR